MAIGEVRTADGVNRVGAPRPIKLLDPVWSQSTVRRVSSYATSHGLLTQLTQRVLNRVLDAELAER